MSEEWRIIADFPDYAVSDLGRVKRVVPDHYGRISGLPLKQTKSNHGYKVVTLHRAAKQQTRLVHRLVCETFHGPAPDNHHAAHGDGDKDNNAASNLRWATVSENNMDKHYHGTILMGDNHHARKRPELLPRGERHGNAKMTDAIVLSILSDNRSQRLIAADHGVSQSLVSMVKNRRIWTHIQAEN